MKVDGYANAWVLPPTDAAVLVEVTYRPARTQQVGIWTGFLALAGASAAEVAVFVRAFARRRRSTAWERFLAKPSRAR
jgi:hypothetical protein